MCPPVGELWMNRLAWILAALVYAGVCFGQTPAEAELTQDQIAERDRLCGEMRRLGKRGVWAGVERKYNQLLKMGIPLDSVHHLTAAYAARDAGDLTEVYLRLQRAAADEGTQEIVDWLYDIDHNYGRVTLVADRKGTAKLVAVDMPLDPNQRKAVQGAIEVARQTGRFEGLLPRGRYEFATQAFKVEPGVGVLVEVSPKMRRQGLIEPVIIYRELPTATGNPSERQ